MPHVFHTADEPERHFDAPNPVWTAADFDPAEVRGIIGRLQEEEEVRLSQRAAARRAIAEAEEEARVNGLREVRRGTDQPAPARQEEALADAERASLLAKVAVARAAAKGALDQRDQVAEEASQGVRTLAEALVTQGTALRDAQALVDRQAALLKRAEAGRDANEVAAGELAARRWLDALVEQHLPATTFERADPDFRAYVTRILRYTAEHANRLLGDFHAIPDAVWERRDATWPNGPQQPDEVDLADLAAMWGHHDDDEVLDREDEEDDE